MKDVDPEEKVSRDHHLRRKVFDIDAVKVNDIEWERAF